MKPVSRNEAIREVTGPGKPHHLVDAVINGRKLRVFKEAPPTLRAMIEASVSDTPFLMYEQERWTFAQAWADSARIAQVLITHGDIKPGDRVAIAMRNYPEWILAFTAITSIGAVAVAINAHWQAEELAYGLDDCGAKLVIADQERLDRLEEQGPASDCRILAVRAERLIPGAQSLDELTRATGDVAMPEASIGPEDLAMMMYTSGSTGKPKGVPSTHRAVIAALLSWETDRLIGEKVSGTEPVQMTEQPGTLLAVPLFHVTGLNAAYLASYRAQRRLVCMYRWDAEKAAQLVESERLTSVLGPSAITGDLVRIAETGQYDLSSLLLIGGGGASRAPDQVRRIGETFANAMPTTGWGMTETNAIGTGISGDDYFKHPDSSGRCSQVLELKIVNEQGETVPTGERGELLVRGTAVFNGYWNRPEANVESFDGDWFRTGDVATIDEEGFVAIVDRLKELIIRGGENIGCGQVEAVLLAHPLVHETSVFAVPDERLGEEVGAVIYVDEALDIVELRTYLAQHLANFEQPRYLIRFEGPLPRTPSGKIFRREIQAAAIAQLKAAENE